MNQVPNACALCTLHRPLYIRDGVQGKLLDRVPNACALCKLNTPMYIRDGVWKYGETKELDPWKRHQKDLVYKCLVIRGIVIIEGGIEGLG